MTDQPSFSVPEESDPTAARRELWRRALSGDAAALEEALASSEGLLVRYIRQNLGRQLRRQTESIDIAQAAIFEAIAALKKGSAPVDVDPVRWLCGIARNEIRAQHDYHHAKRRDADRRVSNPDAGASEGPLDFPADQTDPSDRAARHEERSRLECAVDDLPAAQRRVVVLRDFQALEWPAIAAEFQRSVPACKQLHQRAWQSLRGQLHPAPDAESDRTPSA